jgi:pimeloyl-ACP methyl ester carboxylesterase
MPKVISKDGTSIAFEKTGSGPAVIVVDGALCSRAFGPSPKIVPLLSKQFTVIIYDRRGRNESGDTLPYSVEREIEDIDALINQAGGSACLVGFSSGAALALNAAAKGLNIRKLLLYEPPYVLNMGGYNPPADSEAQLKKFIAAGQRGDAVNFFMCKMVGLPAIFAIVMRFMPVWSKLKAVAHTLPYDAAILAGFSLPVEIAASVKTPTLVVGGEKTAKTLRNAVLQLAKAMPNATSKLLKGQSHNVSMKAIAPEIIEYFKS